MVYRGPSSGCMNCRKRRVKCDHTEPACLNCQKRKLVCPGFDTAFDIVHRDQNAAVQARVEQRNANNELRPSGDQHIKVVSVSNDCQTVPDARRTPSTPAVPFISRQVWQALEPAALSFFFGNYGLSRGSGTTCGWLDRLPALYLKADDDSPLTAATAALAVNISMLWSRHGVDSMPARSLYAKAVTMTKRALDDPKLIASNDLLMTAFILEFYDILNAKYRSQLSARTHAQGALAIIKYRGQLNFKDDLSKRMVIAARTLLANQALSCYLTVDLDTEIWQDSSPMPYSAATELVLTQAKLANLLHRYKNLQLDFLDRLCQVAAVQMLLEEAQQLDSTLDQWLDHIPEDWQPTHVHKNDVAPSILKAGFYGSSCTVYLDVTVVHIWDVYRRARFESLALVHRCLRRLTILHERFDYELRANLQQGFQQVVDDLCKSIPFHVGDLTEPTNPLFHDEVSFPGGVFFSETFGQKKIITMPTRKADHAHRAVSSGGWFVLGPLYRLIRLLREEQQEDGLEVREGQLNWIDGQVHRLQKIYLFPPP